LVVVRVTRWPRQKYNNTQKINKLASRTENIVPPAVRDCIISGVRATLLPLLCHPRTVRSRFLHCARLVHKPHQKGTNLSPAFLGNLHSAWTGRNICALSLSLFVSWKQCFTRRSHATGREGAVECWFYRKMQHSFERSCILHPTDAPLLGAQGPKRDGQKSGPEESLFAG